MHLQIPEFFGLESHYNGHRPSKLFTKELLTYSLSFLLNNSRARFLIASRKSCVPFARVLWSKMSRMWKFPPCLSEWWNYWIKRLPDGTTTGSSIVNSPFQFLPISDMRLLLPSLFVLATLSGVDSYKILVYNSKYGHSHSNFLGMIADTLAEAGHNVVSFQFVFPD